MISRKSFSFMTVLALLLGRLVSAGEPAGSAGYIGEPTGSVSDRYGEPPVPWNTPSNGRTDYSASSSLRAPDKTSFGPVQPAGLSVNADCAAGCNTSPDGVFADEKCCSVFASIDALLLNVRHGGYEYAGSGTVAGDTFFRPLHVQPDQDWGYRIRGGYLRENGRQVTLQYMHLQTNDSEATSAATGVVAIRSHPAVGANTATLAQADATFDYDMVDFDLTQRFQVNPDSEVWLSAGGRWGEIDQKFNVLYSGGGHAPQPTLIEEDFQFIGGGIRVGVGGVWRLGRGFSIFGGGTGTLFGSLVQMKFVQHDNLATGAAGNRADIGILDRYGDVIPTVDASLGVSWEYGPVAIATGYELIGWFNVPNRIAFTDDADPTAYTVDDGNLLLDGYFFRIILTR